MNHHIWKHGLTVHRPENLKFIARLFKNGTKTIWQFKEVICWITAWRFLVHSEHKDKDSHLTHSDKSKLSVISPDVKLSVTPNCRKVNMPKSTHFSNNNLLGLLKPTCVVGTVDDRSHWETQRDAELGSGWTTTSYKTRPDDQFHLCYDETNHLREK